MKVLVRLEDGDRPLKVGDRTLAPGQATSFMLTEDTTLKAGDPGPGEVNVEDQLDVFSPANRPNGPVMTAAIAPKIPKAGGETVQEPVGDGTRATKEVAAAPLGQATQGGGPDSPDTVTTPGPKPQDEDETALAREDKAAAGFKKPSPRAEPGAPSPKK